MTRAPRPWRRHRGSAAERTSLTERLLAVTDQGAYAVDMDGRCLFANDAAARMLGTSPTLLSGVTVHDEHHRAATGTDGSCALCAPIRSGRPARGSAALTRVDGGELAVDYLSSLVEHDGAPVAVFWFSDVAERQQAEAALQQLEVKFRAVTESANDAIVSADARGNIIGWNRAARPSSATRRPTSSASR